MCQSNSQRYRWTGAHASLSNQDYEHPHYSTLLHLSLFRVARFSLDPWHSTSVPIEVPPSSPSSLFIVTHVHIHRYPGTYHRSSRDLRHCPSTRHLYRVSQSHYHSSYSICARVARLSIILQRLSVCPLTSAFSFAHLTRATLFLENTSGFLQSELRRHVCKLHTASMEIPQDHSHTSNAYKMSIIYISTYNIRTLHIHSTFHASLSKQECHIKCYVYI